MVIVEERDLEELYLEYSYKIFDIIRLLSN